MKRWLVLLLVFFVGSVHAAPPEILSKALDAYVKNGKDSFLPVLLQDSVMEREQEFLTQGEAMMSRLEQDYGLPDSWETLAVCEVSDKVKATYYIVYYQKVPIYGYLYSYIKPDGVEVATQFRMQADPKNILPAFPIKQEKICEGNQQYGR